ncbi:MAG TPA: undecaprenyl-diphosphate phosphatase [bacterium]|nr:undecaprenyl-diphosphate phosphatase [bacterium]
MTPLSNTACAQAAQVSINFVNLGAWKVFVLGIVQGITELLPISSTAHLRIVPALLGWPDPGSAFSAAMQLASLVAVVTFLWPDLRRIGRQTAEALGTGNWRDHSLRMSAGIVVGTIPIGVAGLLLQRRLNQCDSPLRGIAVIGWACVIMGVLLALAERYGQHDRAGGRRRWNDLSFADGLYVGIAQAFALIPGVSRSGSTLTAGLALGMERATAAWFSFLLGVPAIVLAGLYELAHLRKAGLTGHGWGLLALGLASGSAASYAALWALVRYLRDHTSWVFAWYRVLLGIALLAGAAAGLLH